MMKIDLVVFDVAGTTLHDDGAVNESFRVALREAGVFATSREVNAVMGLAKPDAIRMILARREWIDLTDREVARIHGAFLDHMITHYETSDLVREVHGTTETFQRLRDMGIKVALDTGFSRPIVDAIVRRLGWAPLLDAVVSSDEVAHGRPHADMIHRAMRLCDVQWSGRVAKVGDTPADLLEGVNARCAIVVGVTTGTHSEAQLRRYLHTHLVNDLTRVPELILHAERALPPLGMIA